VVKILQGSVVTQTTLGGLTIYPQVANFLKCTCAKKYANWLAVVKVIAQISRLTFLAHPVYKITSLISFHNSFITEYCVHSCTFILVLTCTCIGPTVSQNKRHLYVVFCKWSNHCLHHLLPDERDAGHDLRRRGHFIRWFVMCASITL